MVGSKTAYIGLDDLPARISKNNPPKDELVKYFICLCAGNAGGNGSIADKLNLTPMRGEVFRSWLYEAKLITEDRTATDYGMQELCKLVLERKDYAVKLLSGAEMDGELNYLLGFEPKGNILPHKEPETASTTLIPETHDEPNITSPLPGYVEKTELSGDILNVGDKPSGVELLEEVPTKNHRRTDVEMEMLTYAVLEQIHRGVGNETIARKFNISPAYVSTIVRALKNEGCVEGNGKHRHITSAGIEMLNPHKAEGADVPATIEPVRQVSEVKSLAETEPVQTRELKKPFPSFSYRGRAGKNPFGQKQVDKYIGKRWYANMPKSEGMYAKSKEKIEPPAGELPNSGTFIEEIPKGAPEISGATVTPINAADVLETNTEYEEPEYGETDLQILKFLLGVEKGLTADELAALFDGGLYLLESRIRKKGFFTKSNGVYSLPKAGSDELDFLKEEYGEAVSGYLEAINYLRENKKMPRSAKPVKKTAEKPSTDEKIPVEENTEIITVDETTKKESPLLLYPVLEIIAGGAAISKEKGVDECITRSEDNVAVQTPKIDDAGEHQSKIAYNINHGYVRITDGTVNLNMLKINDSYTPNSKERGMSARISPELILLELARRTKTAKKDLMRYADAYFQKDSAGSVGVLERNRGLVKEENGVLELTENAIRLLTEVEHKLYEEIVADESRVIHTPTFFEVSVEGVGDVSLHSPYSTILNKVKEYCAMPKIEEEEEQPVPKPERKVPAKIEHSIVTPVIQKTEPIKTVKLQVAAKPQKDNTFHPEEYGFYNVRERWVVIGRRQKTIFEKGHFLKSGKEYLKILYSEGQGKEFDPELYDELKYLGWLTGDNGNMAKTDKGEIAKTILEEFMSLEENAAKEPISQPSQTLR